MRWPITLWALAALLAACSSDKPTGAGPTEAAKTAAGKTEATPAAGQPVTIYAASSMKELVTELGDAWTGKSGQEVRLQFEASSTLARQIKEGAPADVFITAAPEWLDQLKLIKRFDWLSNTLVCVVRKDVTSFDLRTAESLVLASEQVPAGKYAKAALEHLGIKPPERTIYGSNVRDVLSKVSAGGAQAGIVYATDAAIDPEVRIAMTFPEESHPKILYAVGVVTENGLGFASTLQEPASMEAARRRGFAELK
jgi:molybdate transport system substrate-binding protein